MKKIKLLSSLLEQDDKFDFSPGALSGGAPVQQPKTDNKSKKSDNTKGSGTEDKKEDAKTDPTADRKAKEPWATLLKLSGSDMAGETGIQLSSVKKSDGTVASTKAWPFAVSWTTTGGQTATPDSKTAINVNKTYYFQTEGGSDVSVHWWKSEDDAEGHKYLYSGTYTIGGGKITITGLEGQSEIIDVASSKVTGNVALFPNSSNELNAVKMRFGNVAPIIGWYFYMKMHNLKTESPELYNLIESGLTAKGYPLWKDTDWVLNRKNMTINTTYFKNRTTYYWPVINKVFSQFAAGQTDVPFCSIPDLNNSVTVTTTKDDKQKTTTFTSGYEYLAQRVKSASESNDFTAQEAYCFYTLLAALSKSAISTLNQFATTAGISFSGKDTWEDYIVDQCGGNWPEMYTKYVKPLQETNGKSFPNTSFASAEDSGDAEWFNKIVKMYALGGDHLKDALSRVPEYREPASTQTVWANPMPSDIRLKENIELIGKSNSGLNIYKFKYKDQEEYYQGVMAQELLETEFNSAVVLGEEFYSVNYNLIDVEFKQILN
jgi:hypothetical protein